MKSSKKQSGVLGEKTPLKGFQWNEKKKKKKTVLEYGGWSIS